jgi:hypothetical protein
VILGLRIIEDSLVRSIGNSLVMGGWSVVITPGNGVSKTRPTPRSPLGVTG